MTLYLVAHKVRGEPAFDIAERMRCPVCEPIRQGLDESSPGCDACEAEGYWWIIPTSGHRAYPYWWMKLEDLGIVILPDGCWCFGWDNKTGTCQSLIPMMDEDLPDHYHVTAAPKAKPDPQAAKNLLSQLGLLKPTEPINRRV